MMTVHFQHNVTEWNLEVLPKEETDSDHLLLLDHEGTVKNRMVLSQLLSKPREHISHPIADKLFIILTMIAVRLIQL